MSIFTDGWRQNVFFAGDIRRINSFPWVTWAVREHKITYEEVLEVLPLIQYGDIGIHKDDGYLSNIAIPGFMKHGWIHVEDGIKIPQIVEAVSEGVVKRSSIYPMYSDFTIILSPKDVTDKERKGACLKANNIVGEQYDVNFKFDIEQELHYYTGRHKTEAGQELVAGQEQIRKYDHGFSCTEVVSYAWWHKREELSIYRKERMGKQIIIADDFLNHNWRIKWMSESITPEVAREKGLHEEGLVMIEEFLARG